MSLFSKRKQTFINKTQTEAAQLSTDNLSRMMSGYNENPYDLDIWRDNDTYLEYLHDWSYTRLLLDNLTNPVKEILQASKPTVKLPDSVQDKELYINKQLEKIDILRIINDNIDTIIYDKPMVRYLCYDKDKEIFSSLPIDVKDTDTKIIKKYDKIVGIMHRDKFVSIEKLILGYDILVESKDEKLDNINDQLKDESDDLEDVVDEVKDDIIIYQSFDIKTTFWYQSPLLYQIYLNDIMAQCLGIKDTLKQTILTVSVSGETKRTINLNNITNAMERALNANDSLILNQDPTSLVNKMTSRLMNNIKVLGNITEFSQIGKLEADDDSGKRDKLQAELDKMKQQILDNLGIPQELASNAVTSNRWEILSRSDRYLSAITRLLKLCADIVKRTASSMLRAIGQDIPETDISYSLINSTNVQSQLSRNKVMSLAENTQYLCQAVQEFRGLLGTGLVDVSNAIDELLLRVHRDEVPFSNSFKTKDEIMQMLMKGE
jgi:hypothetical protein